MKELRDERSGINTRKRMARRLSALVCFLLFTSSFSLLPSLFSPAHGARIKDIGYINGVRPNQLIGYGWLSA